MEKKKNTYTKKKIKRKMVTRMKDGQIKKKIKKRESTLIGFKRERCSDRKERGS